MIYLLLRLDLFLLVATTTIEIYLCVVNFVKNGMCNCIVDERFNNLLVVYIKSDIFINVDNKKILLNIFKI